MHPPINFLVLRVPHAFNVNWHDIMPRTCTVCACTCASADRHDLNVPATKRMVLSRLPVFNNHTLDPRVWHRMI